MANIKELHGVNASGADEVIYPVTEASLVGSEHGTIMDEIPYMVSPGVDGMLPADMIPPVYGSQTGVSTRHGGFSAGQSPAWEYAYGVERDITNSSTRCTRIGNMSLHVSLPVQSGMRRCLLNDDGSVNYYLSDTDSTKKADGTDAVLDGTDGMVMVEIPAHWRRFEQDGNIMRVWVSTEALPGFHFVPKCYRSAYEAAVDRTVSATPKLASVVNTSASFRGGNNNADWDGTYRSLLGMPATAISLTNFRAYARNRGNAGKNGAGWNCDVYEVQKTCWWLYAVEYANFNCQLAYNANPTIEGYKQGGLSQGVTNLSNWDLFGYYPVIPCGVTNTLGNKTGVVEYTVKKDDTGTNTQTLSVPSYRGLENPFGHVWSWTDGCKCNIQPDASGGLSEFFVCTDPAKYQDSDYTDYEKRGDLSRKEGYIKIMMVGEYGENMPVEVGASSTTYFADYFYTNVVSNTGQRGVLFGGGASYGAVAGFSCASTYNAASSTYANFGSRLCFIPSVEALEWYHPTGTSEVASLPLLGDEVVKTGYWSAFSVNPPYTISIIFKTGSTVYGATQCLFSSSEITQLGIRVEIDPDSRFRLWVGVGSIFSGSSSPNTLYCLQIVVDGTNVTFYRNGVRSGLPDDDPYTSTTFALGNRGDGSMPFLGEIVSCHVLNYAVLADDVRALWNGGDPVRSAFLAGMLGVDLSHSYSYMYPMTLDGWFNYDGTDIPPVVEDGAIKCAFNSSAVESYKNGIYRSSGISFTNNKKILFSASLKADVSGNTCVVGLASNFGATVNGAKTITLSDQWETYSFEVDNTYTPPLNSIVLYPQYNKAQEGFYYVKDIVVKEIGCVGEYRPSGVVGTGLIPAFSKATVTGVSMQSGGMSSSDSTLVFAGDRSIEVLFTAGVQITNSSAQCVVTDFLGSGSSIFIGISVTGTFYLYIGGTIFYPTPSVAYRPGAQYHFVISYAKGSVANVYVNGEFHGSVTSFTSPATANGLYLGYFTSSASSLFLGVVNHTRVYNYALSADDVSALWNAGAPDGYVVPDRLKLDGSTNNYKSDFSVGSDGWSVVSSSSGFISYNADTQSVVVTNEASYTYTQIVRSSPLYSSVNRAIYIEIETDPVDNVRSVDVWPFNGAQAVLLTKTVVDSTTVKWSGIWSYSSSLSSHSYISFNYTDSNLVSPIEIKSIEFKTIGCVAEYLPDHVTVDAWYPSIGSAVLSAVQSPRLVGDIVTGASMWRDSSGQGAPALAAVGSPSMSYAPVPAEDEIIVDSGYFVTDISTAVKIVYVPLGYVPVSVTVYNTNPSDITNVSVSLGNVNRFVVYGATVASGSSVTGYIGNVTTDGALLTRILPNGLTSSFYIRINATGNTSSGGMRVKVRCRYALGE